MVCRRNRLRPSLGRARRNRPAGFHGRERVDSSYAELKPPRMLPQWDKGAIRANLEWVACPIRFGEQICYSRLKRMMNMRTIFSILATLIPIGIAVTARGQEVSIPDSGLNAAIRDALQKPSGPLTERDLLSLVVLPCRGANPALCQSRSARMSGRRAGRGNAEPCVTFPLPKCCPNHLARIARGVGQLRQILLLDGRASERGDVERDQSPILVQEPSGDL